MATRRLHPGGLARANARIATLSEDLDLTAEDVARLTRIGRHDLAARIVEHQRIALSDAVEAIAADIAPLPRPNRMEAVRRNAVVAAVAAALAGSTIAMSVGLALRGDAPLERAGDGLRRAAAVDDPIERLVVLRDVLVITRTLTREQAAASRVDDDLAVMLEDTAGDLDDDGEKDDVAREAERMANEARQGRVPTPPRSERPPEERIKRLIKKVGGDG